MELNKVNLTLNSNSHLEPHNGKDESCKMAINKMVPHTTIRSPFTFEIKSSVKYRLRCVAYLPECSISGNSNKSDVLFPRPGVLLQRKHPLLQ